MSITFIADNSRSASLNYKGERSYSRTYIAESEDAVSEYDVLDAFTSSVAILSSHPDDALVKLKEIKVEEGDDAHNWRVTTDYGFLDPDEQEENQPPTQRRTKQTWTFTTKTKVLDHDINEEVIQNSAQDFFEEGVENRTVRQRKIPARCPPTQSLKDDSECPGGMIHFFLSRFTFAFDFSACAIFFCKFGILVAGFLGPCRSFLGMVVVLSDSILSTTASCR